MATTPKEVLLQTARMTLRRFTADDVDDLLALDRDPRVRRFVEDGVPVTRQVAQEMLEAWLEGYLRSDTYGFFAAEESATGQLLGWFHLRPRPEGPADEPELGYRLRAEVWGRGLATEGSRALIDHAFERGGAVRVWAETMAVHHASRRVMESAGLRFERSFVADWPVRIPGDEHGDVTYGITREQWERSGGTR